MARNKKNIVTIHGIPGSGKTDTCKELKGLLSSFSHISTGAIAREIGASYGFLGNEFEKFPAYARENNIPYDQLIDARLKEINETGSKLIVDSRLGYFFIPDSFKVLLNTPAKVAAERIFNDPNRKDGFRTVGGVWSNLVARELSDKKKYLEIYSTDYTLEQNFDYIVSTEFPAAEVANMIFVKFRQWYIND